MRHKLQQSSLYFYYRWNQPGQHCCPWITVDGHNLQYYLDKWTVQATSLRQKLVKWYCSMCSFDSWSLHATWIDKFYIVLVFFNPKVLIFFLSLQENMLLASVAQLDAPSNWRPGGRGFNPRQGRQHSLMEIDREIFSRVIVSLPLIQEGQLSISGKGMCTILVNRLED